jgi:anthranilate phosphoribosyltransferase
MRAASGSGRDEDRRRMAHAPPPEDRTASLDVERLLGDLRGGRQPSEVEARRLVDDVLAGHVPLDTFGAWLVALAEIGEGAEAIAGVAGAIRGRMRTVSRSGLPADSVVADTCGTGGDASGSFNISTAAAFVVAGAGQPVAKHGNRAVSSRTGSADVLERLGVRVDMPPEAAARCLREIGLCFCLAPTYHPAMAHVGPLRRSLGRPTVFNLVGPLVNPAGADVQVIGVGRPAAREPLAEAAWLLGARRTLVVSGHLVDADGLPTGQTFDEVSLFGPTDVIDVATTGVERLRWTPEDFGLRTLPAARLDELAVAGPDESAAAIRDVLAGAPGPRRDVVVINAAAVLWAAGREARLADARARAEDAIDSGAAGERLAGLVRISQDASPTGGA